MTDDDIPLNIYRDDEAIELIETLNHYTMRKIRAAEVEHGVTWLGNAGPVYNVWDNNLARALYRDSAGRDYVDYELLKETLGGDRRNWSWFFDSLVQEDHLWIEHGIATPARGMSICECVDVQRLATLFHSTAEPLPASLWARTWWTSPEVSDAQELGLFERLPDLMSGIPAVLA